MISVLVPILSEAISAKRCLNSILRQDCSDFEVILIDAGSKGLASQLVASTPQFRDRITVERVTENRKLWNLLRIGISKARGNSIFIIDESEWLEPQALQMLDEAMRNLGSDAIQMRKIRRIRGIAVKDTRRENTDTYRKICGEEFYDMLSPVSSFRTISPCMSDKFYRKEMMIETLRLNFSGSWGTSEILNLHYFRHARSIAFIDYAGLNVDWAPPANAYSYSRLHELRQVYEVKRLSMRPSDIPALQEELHSRVLSYVKGLVMHLGWTQQAVEYYLNRELSDRFWQSAGITQTAAELIAEALRNDKKISFKNLFRSLMR